ncbi:hypothetical protein [Actinomadura sp. 21ATH]|uniref:hypothetical protein n=1 Tax=Actinomadura sp. 21ATH TaxID=1735444 RepID=UPI0035BF4545
MRARQRHLQVEHGDARLDRPLEGGPPPDRQRAGGVRPERLAAGRAHAPCEQPGAPLGGVGDAGVEQLLLVRDRGKPQLQGVPAGHLDPLPPRRHREAEIERVEREGRLVGSTAERALDPRLDVRPERHPPQPHQFAIPFGDEESAQPVPDLVAGIMTRRDAAPGEHLVADPGGVRLVLVAFEVLLLPARQLTQRQRDRLGGSGTRALGRGRHGRRRRASGPAGRP